MIVRGIDFNRLKPQHTGRSLCGLAAFDLKLLLNHRIV